jgi:hypothetical protein
MLSSLINSIIKEQVKQCLNCTSGLFYRLNQRGPTGGPGATSGPRLDNPGPTRQ